MSECGDQPASERKRTTSHSDKAARAFVSIRAPEAFKAGQDVRAWLQRLDQYFSATNIDDTITQANTLANALSNDVHAALYKLKLSKETWNDPSSLKTILIRQYDDTKTLQTYANEFRNAKQDDNESIIAFFDRVYYLALQAYPKFQERDDIDDVMTSLVQGRFVEGLRSATIRCELLFHPVDNLPAPEDRAGELEQCEKIGTGQG